MTAIENLGAVPTNCLHEGDHTFVLDLAVNGAQTVWAVHQQTAGETEARFYTTPDVMLTLHNKAMFVLTVHGAPVLRVGAGDGNLVRGFNVVLAHLPTYLN